MVYRNLHTIENLRSDLRLLGVKTGYDLIVHVSLRSIGKVEGGYRNFLESLLQTIGDDGTIIAPAFYYGAIDPLNYRIPPPPEELENLRSKCLPFDLYLSPSQEGSFGDIVRLDYRGFRSFHPCISFAAIGKRASEYTQNVPIDDPDGINSPIGRAYKRGRAQILLIGVDHTKNTSLHLAESLAQCPHYWQNTVRYLERKHHCLPKNPCSQKDNLDKLCFTEANSRKSLLKETENKNTAQPLETLKIDDNGFSTITGIGGCSAGFYKIRGIIDFAKYEISGKVGNALTILIEQKPFVDAARDALIKTPWALLCDNPYCSDCSKARELYGLDPIKEREYHIRKPYLE